MPRQSYVEIVEQAVACHVSLAADRLFGRRTVVPNGAGQFAGFDKLANRNRSREAGNAVQVMAAPVLDQCAASGHGIL